MQPYRLPWQRPGLVGHAVSGQPLFPQFGMDLSKFYSMRPPTVDKPQDQGVEAADEDSRPETAVARASTQAGSKRPKLVLTAKAAPVKRMKVHAGADQAERRKKLLIHWEQVLSLVPEASEIGLLMTHPEEVASEVVRLSLVDKATNTLAARLSSISAYINWADGRGLWPPTERSAYQFVAETAGVSAPATRAARFIEALNFAQGAFGFDMSAVTSSRRLAGFCAEQMERLPTRRQSKLLPCWALRALESRLADGDADDDEAVVIGAVLLLISLRARYSDLRDIRTVSVTKEIIEVEVGGTKTSRRSNSNLPIVLIGPRTLSSGLDWWSAFDESRNRQGIPFPTFPLFPELSTGQWGRQQGRLADFNNAMAMVLSGVGYVADIFPTSHGLKATMLAWACRYGLPEESRAALGYHIGRQKPGTVQIYARDRLEPPLLQLSKMLQDVRAGTFDPDAEDLLSWKAKNSADADDSHSDSSSSSSSSSSTSSEDEDPKWESQRIARELSPKERLESTCQHLGSKRIHRLRDGGKFTRCGRSINCMYAQVNMSEDQVPEMACLTCFADARLSTRP